MKTSDIAALLVQGMQSQVTGNTDIGYHIGTVLSWDDTTAVNTVSINGNEFNNLRVITAGPAINIQAGDTVVVMRFQTQYFILGKVAAPGASAAMRSVSDFVSPEAATDANTFTDLPGSPGPTVTTYVGNSGAVLVSFSAQAKIPNGSQGSMSFAITGANNQTSDGTLTFRSATFWHAVPDPNPDAFALVTLTRIIQVINLSPGLTTFTAKYSSFTGGSVSFLNRSLDVTPF